MRRLFVLICFLLMNAGAVAEVGWTQGVTSLSKLPAPGITDTSVMLNVPHRSQGRDPLCVPTSASMILAHMGADHDKWELKALAEGHKPMANRNSDFTYYKDMQKGLRTLGYNWRIRNYKGTAAGFRQGMRDIKTSLRKGRPVMIDVHLREGHTFVVAGYDDEKQLIYIRDPLLRSSQMRVLSYRTLLEDWHNHRFGPDRVAFFPK